MKVTKWGQPQLRTRPEAHENAELDRQKRDQESRARWDELQRQREQQQKKKAALRYRQEQEAIARQRAAQNQSSNRTAAGAKSGASSKPKSEGSTLQGLIGVAGFIGGGVIGMHLFNDNGIAILVVAMIGGWLAAAMYQLILGLLLVAFLIRV